MSHRKLILLVLSVVVSGGAVWFGLSAIQTHRTVIAYLPGRPDLVSWADELQEGVARNDRGSRGFWRSQTSLAKLAVLYHANGFFEEAIHCYEALQQLQPKEARWPHLKTCILAESGRLDEALTTCRRTLVLAPEYLPARIRLGDILLKSNDTASAARAYREALRADAGNPYALLGLARCDIVVQDWERARAHLAEATSLHPDFVGGLSLLVTVYEHFGDVAGATDLKARIGRHEFVDLPDPWLNQIMEECFDPYRLSVTAAVAAAAGDNATARRRLERAISLAPRHAPYRRQLARLLGQTGELAEAREQLERAVDAEPGDADAWLLLVQMLAQSGDVNGAQRALAKALASCPASPSLHIEFGRRLNALGRREEAMNEFRTAYRLRPSEAAPLVELALIYYALQRPDEAVAALKEALEKQPDHPIALGTLTLITISAGDEAGARAYWQRVQQQPSTPTQVVNAIQQAFQQQFGTPLR